MQNSVFIKELPPLNVVLPSAIDWATLGGIFLTGLVVIGSTIFTLHSLKRTLRLQEKTSKSREQFDLLKAKNTFISQNRQKWIDELREDVSDFISTTTILNDLDLNLNSLINLEKQENLSKEREQFYVEQVFKNFEIVDKKNSQALGLLTKLKLRLNPKEDDSNQLIKALEMAYKYCSKSSESDIKEFMKAINQIEKFTKKILKSEWERVKNFEAET